MKPLDPPKHYTPKPRKRGGLALLHFAKTFDCGAEPQELSATLTLHQIYETSDISFKNLCSPSGTLLLFLFLGFRVPL